MKKLLTSLIVCMICLVRAGAQDMAQVDSLFDAGRYGQAVALARQVEAAALAAHDITTLIKAQSRIAEASIEQGDERTAGEYLGKCMSHFTKSQCHYFQIYGNGIALAHISRIYYECGDIDEAISYSKSSMRFQESMQDNSVLLNRACELASMELEAGRCEEALDVLKKFSGLKVNTKNCMLDCRRIFLMGRCCEELGRTEEASELYDELERTVKDTAPRYYASQSSLVFLKLAERSLERCDTVKALSYADMAVKHAVEAWDRKEEAVSYSFLQNYYEQSDPSLSSRYAAMADSLSFEPYVRRMLGKISFYNLDFARRERDRKIEAQKQHILSVSIIASLLIIALLLLLFSYHSLCQVSRLQREQIDALRSNLEQHERLLFLAKASADPAVKKDLSSLAGDMVENLPVKLTQREFEIASLAAQGLMNKEIAFNLGISTRTVETHRNNVYRKFGVTNVSELKYYISAFEKQEE